MLSTMIILLLKKSTRHTHTDTLVQIELDSNSIVTKICNEFKQLVVVSYVHSRATHHTSVTGTAIVSASIALVLPSRFIAAKSLLFCC